MNCHRRDRLRAIAAELRAVYARLEEVRDDEENALAAMPESFQYSPKGEDMEENVRAMDAVLEDLKTGWETLEEMAVCA